MSPSASKLKKKAKARLSRNKHEQDRSEPVSAHDERAGPTNSSPRVEDGRGVDPRLGGSGSTCARLFTLTSLTITLANAGNPNDRDHSDKSNQNATAENSPDWKSTLSATAKLILCTVRDSADAFPPLKSIAGGLCSILENYEVRSTSCPSPLRRCSRSSSGHKKIIKR